MSTDLAVCIALSTNIILAYCELTHPTGHTWFQFHLITCAEGTLSGEHVSTNEQRPSE